MTSTVTAGNQVTIPAALAEKYHVQPGALVEWLEQGNERLSVRFIPSRQALAEKLCGAGAHLQPQRDSSADLVREREQEEADRRATL
jgi:bifunctional DNA-binding transcriptional regulator/antitoxin component of YhaV-PrlF toxin-antitoxin module